MSGSDHRLRIVTMNVQLMTNDAIVNQDAVSVRANAIADAFLDDRWPDVICFNEVLDETSREILKGKLVEEWPHVAEKFGPTRTLGLTDKYMVLGSILAGLKLGNPLLALPVDVAFAELLSLVEVPDDSGLMILSRFPIERTKFVSYEQYQDTDSLADKGVAFARIRRSNNCIYQVLATHMQASYETEDEYRNVRVSQLLQIEKLIGNDATRDFTTADRASTILCGDMNIQGAGSSRQEWQDVFKNGCSIPFFTTSMCDAWDRFIAPGVNGLSDRGITNRNYEKNWESRLDYFVLRDPPDAIPSVRERRPFAVHRMFLVRPVLSDHIGVAAEINLHDAHCCPAEAKDMSGQSIGMTAHALDDAGMVWLRFQGRGTWSFTVDDHTAFEIYVPDNMSQQLGSQYATDLSKIPQANAAWKRHDVPRLQEKARAFAVPVEQFYVRLFRRKDDDGSVELGFYRHLGTSPFDPIDVVPQSEPIGLNWAALATVSVNPPMEFWFRSYIRRAVSGAKHLSRFEVINPTGLTLKAEILRKPDLASSLGEEVLGTTSADATVLSITASRTGDEAVYWRISRTDLSQKDFTARWFSSMNYLSYDVTRPPILACIDETGIDIAGGDEISLQMRPDSIGGPVPLLARREDVHTVLSSPFPARPIPHGARSTPLS